jgi:hypothetical protein
MNGSRLLQRFTGQGKPLGPAPAVPRTAVRGCLSGTGRPGRSRTRSGNSHAPQGLPGAQHLASGVRVDPGLGGLRTDLRGPPARMQIDGEHASRSSPGASAGSSTNRPWMQMRLEIVAVHPNSGSPPPAGGAPGAALPATDFMARPGSGRCRPATAAPGRLPVSDASVVAGPRYAGRPQPDTHPRRWRRLQRVLAGRVPASAENAHTACTPVLNEQLLHLANVRTATF